MTTPVLEGLKWKLPFHIHSDASDKEIGAILGQQEEKGPYAIYYIRNNFPGPNLNYMVTEKEFLVVVNAVNKFKDYIIGYQVIVHTNHATIRYLMKKIDVSGRVVRWLLLLQEFDFTIMDKPRKHNVVADFLYRLEHTTYQEMIEDAFLEEHLFVVSSKIPWFAGMENYLATGKFPQHFCYKEKAKIAKHSKNYSWIQGYMFKLILGHILRRCIREDETCDILHACHNAPPGGHYSTKKIVYKIVQARYF